MRSIGHFIGGKEVKGTSGRTADVWEPMTGDGCRAELFSEKYRDALKAACAEDREIWDIYANNFGPDGFDASIDSYIQNPRNRTFAGDTGRVSELVVNAIGELGLTTAALQVYACGNPDMVATVRRQMESLRVPVATEVFD